MSRAEEMATNAGYCGDIHNRVEYTSNDVRSAYIEGYEQAEKDLVLTWEDIKFITDELVFVGLQSNLIPKSEMLYKEVLCRFNKKKNK